MVAWYYILTVSLLMHADDLSIEDCERISFSAKLSFITSTPYNKLSLMDELNQVNEGSSFNNSSMNIRTFENQEIQTDNICVEKKSEEVNGIELDILKNNLNIEKKVNKTLRKNMQTVAKENVFLNKKLHKMHKVIKHLKKENKSDNFLSFNNPTRFNETGTQNVEIQTEFNGELIEYF